jgi:hypothetical protein
MITNSNSEEVLMTVPILCAALGLPAFAAGLLTFRIAAERVSRILAEELGSQVDAEKARVGQMS